MGIFAEIDRLDKITLAALALAAGLYLGLWLNRRRR